MNQSASGGSAAPSSAVAGSRSAREVLEDHLREGKSGSVDADLARNYSPDLVVLTRRGIYRGHDGMRELARLLRNELPNAKFEYHTVLIEKDVGFLEWTGQGDNAHVGDGVDSYVIRDGKIVAQTIHYTVEPGGS